MLHFLTNSRINGLMASMLLGTLLSGCGGESRTAVPDTEPTVVETFAESAGIRLVSTPPRITLEKDLAGLRAEAEVLPVPEGVDPDLFAELKDSVLTVIEQSAARTASQLPTGDGNLVDDLQLEPQGGGGTLSWTYVNIGDYDLNGEVGISDITPIGIHFDKSEQSEDWQSAQVADGDGNGLISISDITPLGVHFGASVQGYNIYGRSSGSAGYVFLGSVSLESGEDSPRHFRFELASIDHDIYMVAPFDALGEDMPQQDLLSPMAVPLDPGVVQVDSFDDEGVLLSGDVSGIEPGSVIVSSEGRGLLRRVDAVTPTPGGVQLATSQASLEDLFDFVVVEDSISLGFADVEEFIPAIEGITFEEGEPVSGPSSLREPSASTGTIKLSVGTNLSPNVNVSGTISMEAGIDLGLDVGTGWDDFGQLNSFEAVAWYSGQLSGTVKVFQSFKLSESKMLLGTLRLAPVPVPAGPIPIVVTPEIEVWLRFDGKGEAAIQTSSTGYADIRCGMVYERDSGWQPVSQVDMGWDDDNINTIKGSLSGQFSLFGPELDVFIYGVVGPYIHFDAPYINLVVSLSQNTSGEDTNYKLDVTSSFGVKGSVGAEVEALGKTVARYDSGPLFNIGYPVFKASFPLTGSYVSGTVVSSLPVLRERIHPWEDEWVIDSQVQDASVIFSKGLATETALTVLGPNPGIFLKYLETGTWNVLVSAEGYEDAEYSVEIVNGEDQTGVEFIVNPETDDDFSQMDITTISDGESFSEPFIMLEGNIEPGNRQPDGILIDFYPAGSGALYTGTPGAEIAYGASLVADAEGDFSSALLIRPEVERIIIVPWYEFTYGEGGSESILVPIGNNLPNGLQISSTREPYAILGILSWNLDARTSDGTQEPDVPGVPNEDFRLVMLEPGSALVAGQAPVSGLGTIAKIPGYWHWYYFLPESNAQAGDVFYPKVHLLDSVHGSGGGYMVNFVTYFDSELYAEPDQDFLTSSLNNAKGILPIDPFGSGGDWFTTVPEMVIPGT